MIRSIKTPADLEETLALSEERPLMILKHSTRCPVSFYALREFETYASAAEARGVECALVLVVEDRAVSLEVAATLGVGHQSPQAILVRSRRALWHDSHEGVSAEALARAENGGAV